MLTAPLSRHRLEKYFRNPIRTLVEFAEDPGVNFVTSSKKCKIRAFEFKQQ